jgi:hypothetical protein
MGYSRVASFLQEVQQKETYRNRIRRGFSIDRDLLLFSIQDQRHLKL